MPLLWIFVSCLVAVAAIITIVDVVRRHYSGWATAGWIVLAVILPLVGSVIYWAQRKPTRQEADEHYMAEMDLRRTARRKQSGGMGL